MLGGGLREQMHSLRHIVGYSLLGRTQSAINMRCGMEVRRSSQEAKSSQPIVTIPHKQAGLEAAALAGLAAS